MEPDEFDQNAEEHLYPTVEEPADVCEDYPEPSEDMDGDAATALRDAGMGTDEDYGYFGGEGDYLDGSYED